MRWLVLGWVLLSAVNLWAEDSEAKKDAAKISYEIIRRPMTVEEQAKYGVAGNDVAGFMNTLVLPNTQEKFDLPPSVENVWEKGGKPVVWSFDPKAFSIRTLDERGELLLAQWRTNDRTLENCDVIGYLIFQWKPAPAYGYRLLLQNHVQGGWYSGGHPAYQCFRTDVEIHYLQACNVLVLSHAQHDYDYTSKGAPFAEESGDGEKIDDNRSYDYSRSVIETAIFKFSVQPGKLVPLTATTLIDTEKKNATLQEMNEYLKASDRPPVKDGFHGFPHVLAVEASFTLKTNSYLDVRPYVISEEPAKQVEPAHPAKATK